MSGPPPDGRSSLFRFVTSGKEKASDARNLLPTVIGVLIFIVIFFAVVAGTAYIQMGDEALGAAIYIVSGVVVLALYLISGPTARK